MPAAMSLIGELTDKIRSHLFLTVGWAEESNEEWTLAPDIRVSHMASFACPPLEQA